MLELLLILSLQAGQTADPCVTDADCGPALVCRSRPYQEGQLWCVPGCPPHGCPEGSICKKVDSPPHLPQEQCWDGKRWLP